MVVKHYCMAGYNVKDVCDIVCCQLRVDSPPSDVGNAIKLLCPLNKEMKG